MLLEAQIFRVAETESSPEPAVRRDRPASGGVIKDQANLCVIDAEAATDAALALQWSRVRARMQ
ncbi:MAG: hypothetical protein ACP5TE_14380, partial [Verrucomicrobiia bacterium]